jgi:hypothetical protein
MLGCSLGCAQSASSLYLRAANDRTVKGGRLLQPESRDIGSALVLPEVISISAGNRLSAAVWHSLVNEL